MSSSAYVHRHLAQRLNAYLGQFPAVLLLGARQVGKSTFLSHILQGWEWIDLERPGVAERVSGDIDLFLTDHADRVWLDEAQRVPELFQVLRWHIDQDRRPGRFVLSGSASPLLLRDVSESLAGRIGILELGPFSAAEQAGTPPSDLLTSVVNASSASELARLVRSQRMESAELPAVRDLWLCGGYPEPVRLPDAASRWRWFDSYVRTISERDLQRVANGLSPVSLSRLLRMLAARHGQCVSLSGLARDFGASAKTVGRYLDVLEAAFLWRRSPPYFANIGKRLIKSPKAHLVDTGLLHHLLGVGDWASLEAHPLLGASWEGWVIEQLVRQAQLMEPSPVPYHWRTQAGAEVDLVFEAGSRLIPVEIKHSSVIRASEIRGLRQFLSDFPDRAPFGIVIYRGSEIARQAEDILAVPIQNAVFGEG